MSWVDCVICAVWWAVIGSKAARVTACWMGRKLRDLLLWIGLINHKTIYHVFDDNTLTGRIEKGDTTLHYPFHVYPPRMWRYMLFHQPFFAVFRNLPGVIKWYPGRLLPRRWGFRLGIFEFGDRG